jgi:hypothetical protein
MEDLTFGISDKGEAAEPAQRQSEIMIGLRVVANAENDFPSRVYLSVLRAGFLRDASVRVHQTRNKPG